MTFIFLENLNFQETFSVKREDSAVQKGKLLGQVKF